MYESQNMVIAGIRNAYEKFKHYEKFTKRVRPFIQKALPGYTILLSIEVAQGIGKCGHRYEINVYGKEIDHKNSVDIYFNDVYSDMTWQQSLLDALDHRDARDYQERLAQEEELFPKLALLHDRVVSAQQEAFLMIANLPVPKSTIKRQQAWHWSDPSTQLKKKFPELFP